MKKSFFSLAFTATLILGATSLSAGVNEVRISNLVYSFPNGNVTATQLMAGRPVQIEITFDATGGVGYTWLGTNAFEIYSPDGADWSYLQATREEYILALPLKYTPPDCAGVESYIRHFNRAGYAGDFTVTPPAGQIQQCYMPVPTLVDDRYTTLPAGGNAGGMDGAAFYHGFVGSGVGAVGGTSGHALTAEFFTRIEDHGRHICFDTTNEIQAWEWAAPGYPLNSGRDFPTWNNGLGTDGPRCWEVYLTCSAVDWCGFVNTGEVSGGYCSEITYQLCAMPCWEEVSFGLFPPYDNGQYGEVDATTGLWTWSNPDRPPGSYEIRFKPYEACTDIWETFTLTVELTGEGCDCCAGRVGDVNGSGGDDPTIGDI